MTKSAKNYFARRLKAIVQDSKFYTCDFRITKYQYNKLKKDRQELHKLERYFQEVLDELETNKKYELELEIYKEYGYHYLYCHWDILKPSNEVL